MIEAVRVQGRVLNALILREMMSRFGRTRLGYLWALVNPVLLIATLYVVFTTVQRAHFGLPLLMFLVSGYMTWQLFQGTVSRCQEAVRGNIGLLMYPQVTALDVIFARAVLEILTYTVVLAILTVVAVLIEGPSWPARPLEALFAFWMSGLYGFFVGMIAASVTAHFRAADNLIGAVLRLGFFLSGVLFTGAVLPSWSLPWVAWNPLFQVIELVREGWFAGYVSPAADPWYVAKWLILLAAVGLVSERMSRGQHMR